jgi:hypothetical protein
MESGTGVCAQRAPATARASANRIVHRVIHRWAFAGDIMSYPSETVGLICARGPTTRFPVAAHQPPIRSYHRLFACPARLGVFLKMDLGSCRRGNESAQLTAHQAGKAPFLLPALRILRPVIKHLLSKA